MHFNCKRIPRKFKKKHKKLLDKYPFLTLNEKLWYVLRETNKKASDDIIQGIINKN